jgi:hypothetical protein
MATDHKKPFVDALTPSAELALAAEAALRAVDEMASEALPRPVAADDSLTAWMRAVQDDVADGEDATPLGGFARVDAGVAAVRAIIDDTRSH